MYVSNELTHFTGQHCRKPDGSHDENAQYALLVTILSSRQLLCRPSRAEAAGQVRFNGGSSFIERKMIDVEAVYFCDIPVGDLGIHMGKYSAFGLSFPKSFLIQKGANPAFYIASDSVIPPNDPAALFLYRGSPKPEPLTRGELMDRLIRDHLAGDSRVSRIAFEKRLSSGLSGEQVSLATSAIVGAMVRSHILSFCIPFDSRKDVDDRENYYMEREWRVVGDVTFELEDVWRVVLPERYAKPLRRDVRDYCGQVTFPD